MDKRRLVKIILDTLKLILGLILLPFVIGISMNFLSQMVALDKIIICYFLSGVGGFLVLYLFIWQPAIIYRKGQRVLEIIFRFFAPIVKMAPYVLPIYMILISVIYFILTNFIKSEYLLYYTLSLLGFSLTMHLVFTAEILRPKQLEYAKIANYCFGFSLIYIINIFLFGYIFNFMSAVFSFMNLFDSAIQMARDIYKAVFTQLFL